jgi:mannose-6-phosphate isomerase-like protein (cupin superfamily)
MRIALLCPLTTPVTPETTTQPAALLSRLADGLVERGHQVTLFATGDSLSSAELSAVCQRAVARCPELSPVQWDQLHAIEAFRRGREFDLIHSHMDAGVLPLATLCETPVVATIHRIGHPSEREIYGRVAGRVTYVNGEDGDRVRGLRYEATIADDDLIDGHERLYQRVLDGRENHRPWGFYEVLEDRPLHKVKRIVVHPGQRLSLQLHHRRAEHWLVIGGAGLVTRDDDEILVSSGEAIDIPRGARHRIRNPGDEPCVFIEVQTGDYFGEDDIIRFEDDYGRAG